MVELRNLVIVLGDQLDLDAAAFDGFDVARDAVWMAEVAGESTHVWSSKPRTVMFLAAMRHFALALQSVGRAVHYTRLDAAGNAGTLGAQLEQDTLRLRPSGLVMTAPGDWRVLQAIRAAGEALALPVDIREDRHFFSSIRAFAEHAKGRKSLRMEYFYREQRKRHRVLMQDAAQGAGPDDAPVGGQWNFDADNREAFGAAGPGAVPPRSVFAPDAVTQEVIALVNARFAQHPGRLDSFAWPVTRQQALQSLQRFVQERLPMFGRYQDAMWPGDPWLYHAHLSAALNLKLLNPREVVAAAEAAHRDGHAPLASVEGFIRQVLGWREFIRGVYFLDMPGLKEANHYGHENPLPAWYWTGETKMNCMRQCISQTLANGYSHHIQRLMVTGMFGVTAQIKPQALCDWYLAVYVDAVEWVELPNTAGMALFANGGRFTSKPYVASGAYVKRMSNYCGDCAYKPDTRSGPQACPMTVLYWNFLDRHEASFAGNPRTALMVKNLQRINPEERLAIRDSAAAMLKNLDGL